ncbi:MAG TPA: sulfite exporter TauE/SafE family protein [Bacteroidia bacterium]|nr:sulfite exporter TauE/SafE family protein [Bacteroidia bacterium]
MSLILICIAGFIAFSLSALCGGGAGLMLMPLLGFYVPAGQVPAALSIGTFTSSLSRLMVFFRQVNWAVVKVFVPSALPFVFFGAFLLKYVNPNYLELFMGLYLMGNMVFLFRRTASPAEYAGHHLLRLMVVGALAGFLSGLTGAVGLLFNRFYLNYGLKKDEIIATRAANELLLHLVKLVFYALFGLLNAEIWLIGLSIALSGILSSLFMKNLLHMLSESLFRKIGYASMVLSGFVLLIQSGKSVLQSNEGKLSSVLSRDGIEAKLQWQKANYTLEFSYDEGFVFEQVIPFTALSPEDQHYIKGLQADADEIVVEKVFEFGSSSYEAYFFKDHRFQRQIEFE